jgi:hypothetical protein
MKKCPLLNKKCIEHDCDWFVHLIGKNPQTGANQDEWGCSIKWLPILLVENAAVTKNVSIALDRNNNTLFSAFPKEVQQRIVSSNPNLIGPNGHIQGGFDELAQ